MSYNDGNFSVTVYNRKRLCIKHSTVGENEVSMSKVMELNIEHGNPSVEAAISKLKNALPTYKRQGVKAVIVIHGYGSSGVGGAIKPAVRALLSQRSMSGIVRQYVGGESWYSRKTELLNICKFLEVYDNRIAGNEGITVILLR